MPGGPAAWVPGGCVCDAGGRVGGVVLFGRGAERELELVVGECKVRGTGLPRASLKFT